MVGRRELRTVEDDRSRVLDRAAIAEPVVRLFVAVAGQGQCARLHVQRHIGEKSVLAGGSRRGNHGVVFQGDRAVVEDLPATLRVERKRSRHGKTAVPRTLKLERALVEDDRVVRFGREQERRAVVDVDAVGGVRILAEIAVPRRLHHALADVEGSDEIADGVGRDKRAAAALFKARAGRPGVERRGGDRVVDRGGRAVFDADDDVGGIHGRIRCHAHAAVGIVKLRKPRFELDRHLVLVRHRDGRVEVPVADREPERRAIREIRDPGVELRGVPGLVRLAGFHAPVGHGDDALRLVRGPFQKQLVRVGRLVQRPVRRVWILVGDGERSRVGDPLPGRGARRRIDRRTADELRPVVNLEDDRRRRRVAELQSGGGAVEAMSGQQIVGMCGIGAVDLQNRGSARSDRRRSADPCDAQTPVRDGDRGTILGNVCREASEEHAVSSARRELRCRIHLQIRYLRVTYMRLVFIAYRFSR